MKKEEELRGDKLFELKRIGSLPFNQALMELWSCSNVITGEDGKKWYDGHSSYLRYVLGFKIILDILKNTRYDCYDGPFIHKGKYGAISMNFSFKEVMDQIKERVVAVTFLNAAEKEDILGALKEIVTAAQLRNQISPILSQ